MKKIRWGIAGPGIIANKFAEAITKVESAELVGVASRDSEKGKAFALKHNIPQVFSSYEEMAAQDNIDAVYVSTIHPYHRPTAEIFINAKKHVLCEKPLCVVAQSATYLADLAKEKGVFLMEAMWTACLPAIKALQKEVSRGVIGKVMGLKADFCYSIEKDEDPKLFENSLAGGSLLDVGVYCVHFANLIMGEPEEISGFSHIQDGVDHHTVMSLKYKNGTIAQLSSAIKLEKPYDAYLYGTEGQIYVPSFYKASGYEITCKDGTKVKREYPYGDNGFEFEIEEACKCITEGKTESNLVPLTNTIKTLEIMDEIRRITGIIYG